MRFNLRKFGTSILLSSLLFIGGLLVVSFQANIIKVKAEVIPIIFNINHLDFGVVFPSENINSRQFTVHFIEENLPEEINYAITKKRKSLPDHICDQENPTPENCYSNLCPYLTLRSADNEGDFPTYAQIGYSNDVLDNWFVVLEVPPIKGFVGQGFTGEPVDSNGIYGCDIELELL